MNELLNLMMLPLEWVFGQPWVAPFIILPVLLLWATYLIVDAYRRVRPCWKAMDVRLAILRKTMGNSDDPSESRKAFSQNYEDILGVMIDKRPGATALVQAWREYEETLVDVRKTPIMNTSRPSAFFTKAVPSQLRLMFWSNLSVGIGLILTFLGLIVALHTAQQGMSDTDPAQMQRSLITLLQVAGAKFFSSVAGVGSSLLLRRFEYQITRKSKAKIDELCTLLERGFLYMPPQRIAISQYNVLVEQREQLKMFNTDFALQLSERIGGHFQQAIQPVASSLNLLNENMATMGQGLGQGAARAIEEASGGELRALGQTLSVLGERLDALSGHVSSSGDDAARQIREAGENFAGAARDIRDAFDRLATNVDSMGSKLSEQSESTAQAQAETVARALKDMETMQSKSSEAMFEAVLALKNAGTEAANHMQSQVGQALATGVSESQHLFRTALEESGEGLRLASTSLTQAVTEAANTIETASQGFAKSGQSAVQTAEAMSGIVGHTRNVASAIDGSAKSFVSASAPLVQAVQAINEASGKIALAVQAGVKSEGEALSAMRSLAAEIKATQESAQEAWHDYRNRFDGVDKALEGTVLKLGDTLGGTFASFREFTQTLDSEMANAVGKLGNALSAIEEYAESLDKYIEQASSANARAAE